MLVMSNEGKTVFIGTVDKIKFGKGKASDILTILLIKGFAMPGEEEKNEKITVLCWNHLSDLARKMKMNDVVAVQVAFEAGNSTRGKAERFPISGFFYTSARQELLLAPVFQMFYDKKTCMGLIEVWNRKKGKEWNTCIFAKHAKKAFKNIVTGDSILSYIKYEDGVYYPYITQIIHNKKRGIIL